MLDRAGVDAERRARALFDPEAVDAARRRRNRARAAGVVAILVVVGAIGTYVPMTLLAPLNSAAVTAEAPAVASAAATVVPLPQVGASALTVIGAEGFAGTVGAGGILTSSGATDALPIASITKLVTALVVLDAKPIADAEPGPTLTFGRADAALYDKYFLRRATIQPMRAGSTISERDALELMLVVSASNYAEAVSTWAFGSQDAYLTAAETWLAANGLANTTIVEPTGLDPRNTSTTADLLALGKLALANPVIAAIVGSQTLDVPNFGPLANTNELLGVDGISGIKTGTLDEAGACLLFSASVDVGAVAPITVVGVVLGGLDHDSLNESVRAMLEGVKAGFHRVPLVTIGAEIGSYTTQWGDNATVMAGETASVLTWSDTPITSSVSMNPIATGAAGSQVGTMTFVAGLETVEVPVELGGTIEEPDEWWRLSHPFELLG